MELPSLPPVDNLLVDSEWGGVTHAAGAVVAYRDVDGSGSETAGDERLGMLCDGENEIGVEWVQAPDTMAEAAWLSTWGFRAGWQVGVIGSTGRLLSWFYVRGNPSLDPATLRLSETGVCE
jgi:hypothetical protein